MPAPLLSGRERAIWFSCFLAVSLALLLMKFSSTDGDSSLYATMASTLSATPVSRWLSPEWWGLWPEAGLTGLFLEHPAGVFLVPAALQRLGMPAEQGAYIVGVAAGLVSTLLLGMLTARVTSRAEGRAALVLLQVMPVAFIFRIRANHEYLMLVCLLAGLLGLDIVKRSWWGLALVAFALAGGLIVKGFFVSLIALAMGLWTLLDPTRSAGSRVRQWIACAVAVAAMGATALAYDAIYLRATGVTFWAPYWARQIGPVTFASPLDNARTIVSHLGFYALRLLWHPAPWSLALLVAGWAGWAGRRGTASTGLGTQERMSLWFVLAFTVLAVLLLSTPNRFAERYAFSATFLVGTAGVVAAWRVWPGVRRAIEALDSRIPALPAITWAVLIGLRLVLGRWLPHVG
jgi:4-amino-4-deoxy-L-arabinose transferase-like glycosyltransferase